MGALFIFTTITDARIETAGQPQTETIECENYLNMNALLQEPFVETVRFSDPLQANGLPVRYYHLLNRLRGCTLCLDPFGSGRLMYGFYNTRELRYSKSSLLSFEPQSSSISMPDLHALSVASHVIISYQGGELVLRTNCIEHFRSEIVIHSSISIPSILLVGSRDHCQLDSCDSAAAMSSDICAFQVKTALLDSRASLTLTIKETNLCITQGCFKIKVNSSIINLTPAAIRLV